MDDRAADPARDIPGEGSPEKRVPGSRKGRAKSVKFQLLTSLLAMSTVLSASLAGYFALVFYPQQVAYGQLYLRERNNAINVYIEGYFREIVNSIEILARNPDVIEVPWSDDAARERALAIYREFQASNDHIYFIYSGYVDGRLFINGYEPPPGYTIFSRPWYRAVMDHPTPDSIKVGLLYREAKSDELLLSTVHALDSDEHGITGVVVIDSYTQAIADQIGRRSNIYESSYSFIADEDWVVLVHPDSAFLGQDVNELVPEFGHPGSGTFVEYSLAGKRKLAYVSAVALTGWRLVTTVEFSDIEAPIFRDLVFYVLVIALIVAAAGIASAATWRKSFMRPLVALRERVATLVETGEIGGTHPFPDNEVGEIARNIEKLATSALIAKNRELESLAIHDYLTGIFNRRKVEELLSVEYGRAKRYGTPCSLLIADIDHFKTLNDEFGHKAGDEALVRLARAFDERVRATDAVGRWGGEEFMLVLRDTALKEAVDVAESLRKLAASLELGTSRGITVSVGAAELAKDETLDAFILRVDANLYRAKETGRDRVVWD